MVFYMIGLGLSSPEDISVRGLKAVQSASRVYLEMYTGWFLYLFFNDIITQFIEMNQLQL